MTRLLFGVTAAALLSIALGAQSSAPPPHFDVAGISTSTRPLPGMRGGVLRGTRYELRNATMLDLVRTAYNVQPDFVRGGPSWLEWNRYDVTALAPVGTPPAALREMLKALLVDRFKLAAREDAATASGFALKVGAGTPKLRQSSAAGGCQGNAQPEANGVVAQNMTCRGLTMAMLAEQLPRMAGAYFPGGAQVIDDTGLAGNWDFELKWTPRALLPQAGSDGMTIASAVEKLGLKLEARDVKVAAIVVGTVTAVPTPNPPDLATRMPAPPPPEFEVADVKPSPADVQGPRAQILPNGQVTATGVPLSMMIGLAWDLPNEQFIVGPKWLASSRFELIARAFTGGGINPNVDEDILRLMLRALIVDRFQMKYHMEERPMSAYTLTADKPRLTRSEPTRRTRCAEGPAPSGADPRTRAPILSRLVTCQNVSMAQFAQLIPNFAGGYTRVPALDKTGLDGGWDFTLNFSTVGQVQGPRPDPGAAAAGAAAAASDPSGALSLPDAISRQLGLKLREEKRPLQVLVIDTILEKPSGN